VSGKAAGENGWGETESEMSKAGEVELADINAGAQRSRRRQAVARIVWASRVSSRTTIALG
jgi:hypothetical protein